MAEALIVDSPLLLAASIFSVESEFGSEAMSDEGGASGASEAAGWTRAVAAALEGSLSTVSATVEEAATVTDWDEELEVELAPLPVLLVT